MNNRRKEFLTFLQDVLFAFIFVIFNILGAVVIFREQLF